jgi:hypothetical protein
MVDAEWTVERHLSGRPPEIVALYHRFIELAGACGPFTYSVAKSAITLKGARRGFAGARPGNRALSGYLDLQRRVDDPRITRSSPYTGRLYVHQFRIRAPSELDDEFAGWIHEAYQVGNGAHLGGHSPHGGLQDSGLLERRHEGSDALQGGRGLPDRIDLGIEARQVMNALQEPLP